MNLPAKYATPPGWYDKPLRWANLTLVQDDPGKYDPDFWLDLLRRARCDAASWNSGGIIAFYPTNLPFHRRNEAMGDTDPLGYLVEGCRKLGILVTARVDHHATYEEAALAHPEWIFRDRDGQMRRHWAKTNLFVTCPYGPYNSGFMTSVLREIETMYGVDGFNHNRWSRPGGPGGALGDVCHCAYCRETFGSFSGGMDLPTREDHADPIWRQYLLWQQERIFALWDLWDGAVRAINPNAGILPGIPSSLLHQVDIGKLRTRAHTLYHDHQGRSGVNPPWSAGKGGKELRAVLGKKAVGLTFSVGQEGGHRWKDSVQSEAEVRMWALNGVANGMHLKFCKFSGFLHDTRWPGVIERLYTYLHRAEPYLRNEASLARVALVYSQQTRRFYNGAGGGGGRDGELGMYHALIEARILFEMVHESLLDANEVDRYKLLILPNVAALSNEQCDQLRQYVNRGGSLFATHETSLCDEWGERRADFGLADLFGVSAAGPTQGPMKNSYLRLHHEAGHPVLADLENAARVMNGVFRVPVKAREEFPDPPPVTLIPPYPDLPMEEVYPRADHSGICEVYLRQTSAGGRVAYVPWDIDRVFWEMFSPDHALLIRNLARWAASEPPPVTVDGPGLIEVTAWRQKNSLTVHLVNLTNPMMLKGPIREFYPVGPLTVRLRLPAGATPTRVQLLAAQQTLPFAIADGVLTAIVPLVSDHEIVAVDL